MSDEIQELLKISKFAGMREDLVQTGGGNSSVKLQNDTMYIKEMGVQMADMRKDFGISVVSTSVFTTFLSQHQGEISVELGEKLQNEAYISGGRPAIETFFHALTDRVTLHTHPTVVNALVCRRGGMELLQQWFPDAVFVDYASPGLPVAWKYYQSCLQKKHGGKRIAFLKNHGLIVSGANADAVIEETERVIQKIETKLGVDNTPNRNTTVVFELLSSILDMENDIVIRAKSAEIINAYKSLTSNPHSICPDSVTFCGAKLLVLTKGNERQAVESFCKQFGKPIVILYEEHAYIVAPTMRKAKEIESVLMFCAEVLRINEGNEMDVLAKSEVDFLCNWEVEKYRSSMNL